MERWKINFKDYYSILEISPFASIEIIKTAYKTLMKQYHPDSYLSPNPDFLVKAQEINEAYETLSDISRAELYFQQYTRYYEDLWKKGNHFSFQFLKKWQAELEKRERLIHQKEKMIAQEPLIHYPQLKKEEISSIQQWVKKFDQAKDEAIAYKVLQEIQKGSKEALKVFVDQVIVIYKLPLMQEMLILELIFKQGLLGYEPFVYKAFKYKSLYSLFFNYIRQYKLMEALPKLDSLVYQTEFFQLETIKSIEPLLILYCDLLSAEEFQKLKKWLKNQMKKISKKELQKQSLFFQEQYENVKKVFKTYN